jgi:SagB-type dehydrogenase family enzyme
MAASDMPLTIRLANGRGTMSLDDGTTNELPAHTAAGLFDHLPPIDHHAARTRSRGSMSAGAQAALAEARLARPATEHQLGGAITSPLPSLGRELGQSDSAFPTIPLTDIGPSRPFAHVLADRRSVRDLGPVRYELVGTVMARAGLTRRRWEAPDGYSESSAPAPSAGARHPHLLVLLAQRITGLQSGAWILDSDLAVLTRGMQEPAAMNRALGAVTDALRLAEPPPAVVFTVARPSQTLDRYPGGMSLLWRDAGVLLGVLHLAAADLGLGSCIVGTSGVLHPNEGDASMPVDTGAIAIGTLL